MQQSRAQELDARTGRARARERAQAWSDVVRVGDLADHVRPRRNGQRGRAAADGLVDAVALAGSEEHGLVGVANRFLHADMTHEEPSVWQVDQIACAHAFGLRVRMIVRLVQMAHAGDRQLNRSGVCLDCV